MTLALTRAGAEAAGSLGARLRGVGSYPQVYEVLRVSSAVFADTVDIFEQYGDQELSSTDATTVALRRRHDLDRILSFDDDFDGVAPRLDPARV